MKKFLRWLKESNRYAHLLCGAAIGAGADNWYCTMYAGIGVATAVELKDKMWGGKFDMIDLGLTVAGAVVGRLIRIAVCGVL